MIVELKDGMQNWRRDPQKGRTSFQLMLTIESNIYRWIEHQFNIMARKSLNLKKKKKIQMLASDLSFPENFYRKEIQMWMWQNNWDFLDCVISYLGPHCLFLSAFVQAVEFLVASLQNLTQCLPDTWQAHSKCLWDGWATRIEIGYLRT